MTSEDIQDFTCAPITVIISVCKLVRLLQLLVVISCVYKCSLNPITNPNPTYSHTHTCDIILLVPVDLTLLCKVLCLCGTGNVFNYISFNKENTQDITLVSNNYTIIPK
jgi:hypothetical protein